MGQFYGNEPRYNVTVICFGRSNDEEDDQAPIHETFTGPRAASDANARFEEMKSHPEVRKVWLTRLDGDEWKFVARQCRSTPTAAWEDLPSGAA